MYFNFFAMTHYWIVSYHSAFIYMLIAYYGVFMQLDTYLGSLFQLIFSKYMNQVLWGLKIESNELNFRGQKSILTGSDLCW